MKKNTCLKIAVLLFLVMAGSLPVKAQQYRELLLWPELQGVKTADTALLKVYLPAKSNGMAVIACPGGGYSFLALEKEGTGFASYFNDLGIALIVLKYRLPNGHPDVPLNDAKKAMHVVKKHAAEWHIDLDKIGIMGASAGGHLAATLCTHASDGERPAFQVLLYPVISMKKELCHAGSRKSFLGNKPTNRGINYFSNELQVTSQTPRAFIVVSDDDKTVSPLNSVRYYEALHRMKIPAELHVYPEGGHGWGLNDHFLYKKDWTKALTEWLRLLPGNREQENGR
ncbi:hypothetical protein A8C56_20515 [Niabella ginsenosidivorans]|uniref:Alpha/beta hydrolase fold-3 domain-containing protein n=1 Tax=Niabella ginsenosidivorans TaxID=1176587 RepID=A0A1A9I5V8_9BACT|nr:alpha/beta hydrolase [Niabella ginsenosidivorans]ANH83048.1 hypothetical protein A8C56_20515 [Niabella ginsenosidivorans]